jgi:hypothetical protein
MGSNLTIESPNFEKIGKEAGQFTSDAVNLLWASLNDTRKSERMDFRRAKDIMAPKVLTLQPTGSVDNLDLQGCSVVSFTGSSSVNFTGMRAPDTGETRVVIIQVSGSGTITVKHNLTSETANQFVNKTGADVAMATNAAAIYIYLASKWRQIA